MIADIRITEKSFGSKSLFSNVHFSVQEHEKIGLIGRNGIGKSTILKILMGQDSDFTGDITLRRGAVLVSTDQEYSDVGDQTVLTYILAGLPEYLDLSETITQFATIDNPKMRQVTAYSEALDRFYQKNYHFIEDQVREELKNFQLADFGDRQMSTLSGGQKRLVEVVKIMHSHADLALVDEPTNFMDYVAKDQFIKWLRDAPEAVIVITHDRDVLREVDKIIEIKDGTSPIYKGNYEAYLTQNTVKTSTSMNEYEVVQRQIENLKKQITYARSKKASWGGTADKKNPFVVMEERALREIKKLQEIEKPSFWIDRGSAESLNYKDAARYQKYKTKNVRIGLKSGETKSKKTILSATDLALGYGDHLLFEGLNLSLHEGETLEIRGRNGAGKTTLIKALLGLSDLRDASTKLSACEGEARAPLRRGVAQVGEPHQPDNSSITVFAGETFRDPTIRIGIYEQEVSKEYFDLTLEQAIERVHLDKKVNITTTKIRQLLADYLFTEPDRTTLVRSLSGGQKARLQIISMLATDPQLLILDEPTSHLDLPSIEELETALVKYHGAILFVSHDNYFRHKLPHTTIEI